MPTCNLLHLAVNIRDRACNSLISATFSTHSKKLLRFFPRAFSIIPLFSMFVLLRLSAILQILQ